MSQYPPTRPWANPSAIDREGEPGTLHEDERQQWFRQNPHVAPYFANLTDNKSLRPFADRGPSMATNLRGIAERGAARRNGTAVNKNDVFIKPLPPIPREAAQLATAGQEGGSQGSMGGINKMSIPYVLNSSDMRGNQVKAVFFQGELSQPATEAVQDAGVNDSVHSTEKMKLNLLLQKCKLRSYDDNTPCIQRRESEPAPPPIVPLSDDHSNTQVSNTNQSSVDRRLALAALCHVPVPEDPHAQLSSSPHLQDHSLTSWYQSSPTDHEFIPDAQVAVAHNAPLVPETKQENQSTEAQPSEIEKLIALINREKERYRHANEDHNSGSPSSAYRRAPPNSASTNLFHANQETGSGYQLPDFIVSNAWSASFASPGSIPEPAPTTPVRCPTPSHAQSPCPKERCYRSEDEFDQKPAASFDLHCDQKWPASGMPPQESPVLPSSSSLYPPLEESSVRDLDHPSELGSGIMVPFGHDFDGDDTIPDSPLLDSPPSSERHPSDHRAESYALVPRIRISPSDKFPQNRLATVTINPGYMSSQTSCPSWLAPTEMNNVYRPHVPQNLNVIKRNPAFTMNVPIYNVSQHQTDVRLFDSTIDRHSRAASLLSNEHNVSNPSGNSNLSCASQSSDVVSFVSSEDSHGTKRKRFTKNLFGKKGYLEDNGVQPDKRFKFIKGAIEKGHSTIGSIKGMIWVENRALINPSKPSIVTDNTAPITLNTDVQSILYAELENMITHAANEFLMKEYYDGHLSAHSLNKVKRRWERKNMPGVPEFHFDQTTQYKIISKNRAHLKFGQASNGLRPYAILRNWKKICKNMSIRTFVSPDSVIKKHIHDILDLLEILNADECHIELIMALDAHIRGELKKHNVMKQYRDFQNSGTVPRS